MASGNLYQAAAYLHRATRATERSSAPEQVTAPPNVAEAHPHASLRFLAKRGWRAACTPRRFPTDRQLKGTALESDSRRNRGATGAPAWGRARERAVGGRGPMRSRPPASSPLRCKRRTRSACSTAPIS